SFRCPKNIIKLARKRAPQMKWSESAPDGEILDLTGREFVWGPDLFPRSCAIICRNNAPLLSLGLKLLRAGRNINLRGFDISKRLVKYLREFGDLSMPREELIEHLGRWRTAKIAEGKLKPEAIEDRYSCLYVFASATEN